MSVASRTTVTTHPLTVCSSATSVRTTLSLEELRNRAGNEVQLQVVGVSGAKDGAEASSPPGTEASPKHITQDSPVDAASPSVAPPAGLAAAVATGPEP